MTETTFKLELTEAEINAISIGLGELKLKNSLHIYQKIQKAYDEQKAANGPIPSGPIARGAQGEQITESENTQAG